MTEVWGEGAVGASGGSGRWGVAPDSVARAEGSGAVASTDRIASEVGATILARGGSAADAAVATALALAVVNPEAGGLGGCGYLLHRDSAGEVNSLDFRSAAPANWIPARPDSRSAALANATTGMAAAAVPGVPAGLVALHQRAGRLPWRDLVQPSIELAGGFIIGDRHLRSFTARTVEKLRRFPESAAIFLPDGKPPRPGATFHQDDLALTLEALRDRGAEGFYDGEIASRLVEGVRSGGGSISHTDLSGYRALWKEPIRIPYREHTVFSVPPSSAGGVVLAIILGIFEHFDLNTHGGVDSRILHLQVESYKHAFALRNRFLGDPDFVEVSVDRLLDRGHLATLASTIGDRARSAGEIDGSLAPRREGKHTTHLSVVDREGNAVSMTLTLNTWYGSGAVAAGTGVLLNCDMDDFTLAPGEPNHFGLIQGEANAPAPGKRPVSAMSPALVHGSDGKLRWVLGTPGGATIHTTTAQILSHLIDRGASPDEAIAAPRIHHQHLPDQIEFEPAGLKDETRDELAERGHHLREKKGFSGDVQLIRVGDNGHLTAWSDPRRGGAPAVI